MTDAIAPIDAIHACWNEIGVRGNRTCPELVQHVHCRNCPTFIKAAADLLDREPPSGYRDAWQRHLAAPTTVPQDSVSMFVFRIGREWLALSTRSISEVATQRAIHSLPHRDRALVLGLASVRGELVACVSLGRLLGIDGMPARPQDARIANPRLVVTQGEGGRLAFPVDEVHGAQQFSRQALQAVPASVAKARATYTTAVVGWGDRSIGQLDDALVFYALGRGLA